MRKLKKEIRELVQWVQRHGWTVHDPKNGGYLKAACPCGKHLKRIPYSPSGSRTLLNLRKRFERFPCWEDRLDD